MIFKRSLQILILEKCLNRFFDNIYFNIICKPVIDKQDYEVIRWDPGFNSPLQDINRALNHEFTLLWKV